ncbi:MAG: hypothetical protein QOI96_480 [Verrucomicrobiota bacterium]
MFKRLLSSLIVVALLTASRSSAAPRSAATQNRLDKYWRILEAAGNDTFRVAARIRPSQRIGEFEAYVLASAYFYAFIDACGGVELPIERGDRWIAESCEGYAGAPGPVIIVDKKTGMTYSPGRHKVRDPKEYLRFSRKNI